MKTIATGAEAVILLDKNNVIKKRIKKSYRIKELDEPIRRRRTKSETKLLKKASKIVNVPKVEISKQKNEIIMEHISGKKLSEHLDKILLAKQKQIMQILGESIAKLHDNEIIHGDLTTSNLILKDNKIYFIDFGLGFISRKYEDKAVDLYLLKQALEAKHFKHWEENFKELIKSYKKSKDSKIVLERLKAVEKRRRYRH